MPISKGKKYITYCNMAFVTEYITGRDFHGEHNYKKRVRRPSENREYMNYQQFRNKMNRIDERKRYTLRRNQKEKYVEHLNIKSANGFSPSDPYGWIFKSFSFFLCSKQGFLFPFIFHTNKLCTCVLCSGCWSTFFIYLESIETIYNRRKEWKYT